MRIRTVKPEFFLHDGLYEAEKETKLPLRLAYIGLWCAADREGRFKWEPRRLGVMILPYDGVGFSRVLESLWERGFLSRYGSKGQYGCIPSFKEHQHINLRETQSILPAPTEADEYTCTHVHAHGEGASRARTCGREGKGREGEGNGKEGEITRHVRSPVTKFNGRVPTSPIAIRLSILFERKPTSIWDWDEIRAFNAIGPISEEDLNLLERYYAKERTKGPDGIQRRSLLVCLRHFPGELDKARGAERRRPQPSQEEIPPWVMAGMTEEAWREEFNKPKENEQKT